MLAIDRVVFAGQPVAAVAADDLAIADEALDLIEVEYEPLPVAADPLKSMLADAPARRGPGYPGRHQRGSGALRHRGYGHPDDDPSAQYRAARRG